MHTASASQNMGLLRSSPRTRVIAVTRMCAPLSPARLMPQNVTHTNIIRVICSAQENTKLKKYRLITLPNIITTIAENKAMIIICSILSYQATSLFWRKKRLSPLSGLSNATTSSLVLLGFRQHAVARLLRQDQCWHRIRAGKRHEMLHVLLV